MSDRSKIEWTNASWNPIRARNIQTGKVGWHCEHVTAGCEHCYAESFNMRLGTGLPFKPGHRKDIQLLLDKETLLAPVRWKKPRLIFVCSMTDLFADFVPDEWIDAVFATMATARQHTFQVLTKRSGRMRGYMATKNRGGIIGAAAAKRDMKGAFSGAFTHDSVMDAFNAGGFPNVWLGVSAECQEQADERIPNLAATPAATRFVSYEPALGPLFIDAAERIDWVIVGGESGPHARPFDLDWARNVLAQCTSVGMLCFVKQLGSRPVVDGSPYYTSSKKGGDPQEWPADLRVREMPAATTAWPRERELA